MINRQKLHDFLINALDFDDLLIYLSYNHEQFYRKKCNENMKPDAVVHEFVKHCATYLNRDELQKTLLELQQKNPANFGKIEDYFDEKKSAKKPTPPDSVIRQKLNENANIYLFLDRVKQTELFEEKLGEVGIYQPYIFIIHGFADDRNSSLVERFTYITEEEYTKTSATYKFDFPLNSENPGKALLKKMTSDKELKSLNIDYEHLTTAAALATHEHFSKQILIFDLEFDSRFWNKTTIDQVIWLVDKFWAFDLIGREPLPCFVFINIMYDSAKVTFLDKIKGKFDDNAIEKLLQKTTFENKNLMILERLPQIVYEDYQKLCNDNDKIILPELIAKGQTRTMKDMEKELKQFLVEQSKNKL